MTVDVARAIDRYAVSVIRRTESGGYVSGEWVADPDAETTITAAIFPASGDMVRDLPEGERADVDLTAFSRTILAADDAIIYRGAEYRVTKVAEWTQGAFSQAWLKRS